MANRTEGVTEKLLDSALEEFRTCGYEKASLRHIAEKAGSSKGAIYIRYPDKRSLFKAIVDPVIDQFCQILEGLLNGFGDLTPDEQKNQIYSYANKGFDGLLDFVYENMDVLKLIIAGGENEVSQAFVHRIADIDCQATIRFIESTDNDALISGGLSKPLIHMLSSGFYSCFFEVILHDMPREEAKENWDKIIVFYREGWKRLLGNT